MKPVTASELIDTMNRLMSERDEARRWARRLYGRMRILRYDYESLRNENADFRSRLERWHAERDALRSEANDLRAELGRWKAENAALRAEVENMRRPVGMCPAGTKPPE